jgi:hypothetical protein
LPNGKTAIVTASGNASQADDFTYYDSTEGITFSFNPFTYPFTQMGEIVSEEPMVIASSPLRDSLVQELADYTDTCFRNQGNTRALYAVHQLAEDHVMIEISCHNVKLESKWAGEWQSTWTIQGGKLSGDLKIKSHYFEMGNMQFSLEKSFDAIPVKDAASAKDIIAAIKKVEDKVSKAGNQINLNCVVPRRTGGNVPKYTRKPTQENEKSSASNGAKVRLGQANEHY